MYNMSFEDFRKNDFLLKAFLEDIKNKEFDCARGMIKGLWFADVINMKCYNTLAKYILAKIRIKNGLANNVNDYYNDPEPWNRIFE